jgi:hypothetical protein
MAYSLRVYQGSGCTKERLLDRRENRERYEVRRRARGDKPRAKPSASASAGDNHNRVTWSTKETEYS